MKIVNELERNCFLNCRVNTSFLVMVPKIEGEKRVGDLRQISLIHGVYKILSKALALRSSTVMEHIISENQRGGESKIVYS